MTLSPIPWLGLCFEHFNHGDRDDQWHLPGEDGYLRHERSSGMWLASLRGAVAVARREPDEPAWRVDDSTIARRALDQALAVLRARVTADQAWLDAIDRERGEATL